MPEVGLREINHGRWEAGRAREVERSSAGVSAWEQDPFTFAPEGGECGLERDGARAARHPRMVEAHGGETSLVVSHKATIRLIHQQPAGL